MGMRVFTDSYRPGGQGHHCSKLRKTHGESRAENDLPMVGKHHIEL